jgi:CRISPR-associated protein Cas1
MPDRIVEIATDGRHLAVDRGFMTVSEKGEEITRIPLDDIAALIGTAHGLTYSNNLLVEFARRNVLFVFCSANHNPVGFLWAVDGFHQQAARIDAQLESTLPKSKQLWKQIVQAKVEQQAAVLEAIGQNSAPVLALAKKVRSGDPDNIEAQAARRYWGLLFGEDFRRDRDAGGINGMLNYGYMIIRSAVARSIMAAGLHPSLPIHHKNANNPMRLVDDVMEPFRPYADFVVWHLSQKGHDSVAPEIKRVLASLLDMEIATETGMTALRAGIQNTAISLAQVYEGEKDALDLPLVSPPLWQPHLEVPADDETLQRTQTHVDDGHV